MPMSKDNGIIILKSGFGEDPEHANTTFLNIQIVTLEEHFEPEPPPCSRSSGVRSLRPLPGAHYLIQ
jgi:hypothetical protein